MKALIGKRIIKNLIFPVKQFKDEHRLIDKAILSYSETELWNSTDNVDNWILTAGKIQNLRIAARKLNGIEIKANEVFSFWKQIGNPNHGQGYVIGREIREGCIVPTIAGGLCQLSNAIYDAALKANFQIIERHKHSKVIPGSLAEQDRDATVKWNYVDLRFISNFDFRIEVELTSDKLRVIFKSDAKSNLDSIENNAAFRISNNLNDCYSCGNNSCFKHPNKPAIKNEGIKTCFILDEKWPEYNEYIQTIASNEDYFIVPMKKNFFLKTDRYSWTIKNKKKTYYTTFEGIKRALRLRLSSNTKQNIFELGLQLDKAIATKSARLIPIECTHLVISQNLLPHLYATGVLGGRTFDVLMTRLPIEKIHDQLDAAHHSYPTSKTLKDFRASNNLMRLENKALTKARKIITPHSEIGKIFNYKSEILNWYTPLINFIKEPGSKILFPGSSIGRKGAYEVKRLAEELMLSIVTMGNTIEEEGFWQNVKIEKFNGDFSQIGLIIYPTYIEHQPRLLLKARSMGIRIVTTAATGMIEDELVKVLPVGNYDLFKEEVIKRISV